MDVNNKQIILSFFFSFADGSAMSLNLTVPKETGSTKDKPKTPRRAKSPNGRLETSSSRTAPKNPRAKSKSPNPSFCSVLSRVKDWELGAFTPKTALAENVDVFQGSNVSEVSSNGGSNEKRPSPNKDNGSDFDNWKASPSESMDPTLGDPGGTNPDGKSSTSLLKSTLSSNIGKRKMFGPHSKFSCSLEEDIFEGQAAAVFITLRSTGFRNIPSDKFTWHFFECTSKEPKIS